jgi:dihydrodipicolinate synthase/N-acetylneuraminate lyase
MKTSAVTPEDLARSVLAVPPLARHADLTFNRSANAALLQHLTAGGVTTFLYGGNANFYNIGLYEYAEVLDGLAASVSANGWLIPSVGPDYGKMMDQLPVLRSRDFPTVMVLPLSFGANEEGLATGLRRFSDGLGRPVILYIKSDGYVTPRTVRRLVDDKVVAAIKYAVIRPDPRVDPYLTSLLNEVDRRLFVSGMGERPATVHMRDFGFSGFTSGSVCVAPRGSAGLLAALQKNDYATAERLRELYLPLEDLRDGLSMIRVLHEAVTLSGIADMGPMLPLFSNLEARYHDDVRRAAKTLLTAHRDLA